MPVSEPADVLAEAVSTGRHIDDHPVDPRRRRLFWIGSIRIVNDERETTRPRREVGPLERRRHVDPVAGVLRRDLLAVTERG